ncbi:MAG TPA: hypothetical protein VFT42_05935 [Solirubrobacteraceae bacterium]|nr:hypothetical protein [Solirubrobacteraceae bacterium]
MSPLDPEIPPAGEEIHLPGPSIQPFLLALFLAIAIVGITASIVLVILGVVVSLVIIIRWIADTRREINELPLEHDEH